MNYHTQILIGHLETSNWMQMSSKHDKEVRKIAKKLKREGWNVKADLKDYEKPSPIGEKKRIPDIEATKRGSRRIYEVEGVTEDPQQIRSFQQSAKKRPRTRFILKKKKKR